MRMRAYRAPHMLCNVMLLLACLLLTCCTTATTTTEPDASTTAKSEGFSAAILYFSYEDVYVNSVRNALTRDLAEAGIAYQEYDAGNDQAEQNSQVTQALANGADVLIVNIVTSGNVEKTDVICQAAYKADVPVIFFNRPIEGTGDAGVILDYYENVALVSTNSAEAGQLQGDLIGEYLVKHYDECDLNGDGVISYASFKGEASNIEAIARTKYSTENANAILEKNGYPDLAYFDSTSVDSFQLDLTGSWSADAVTDYLRTDLAHFNMENGNMIELVICNSDAMAEGAIKALQTFGYNTGEAGSTTIPVFGVDASTRGKELIAQGLMAGTVAQDANAMAKCVSIMTQNVQAGRNLLDNLDSYPHDTENGLQNMICIPYSIYKPEE